MKLKNKVLIAAAAMLVTSAVASGTGVFAWYAATRLNSVSFNAAAQSLATGVSIALVPTATGTKYTDAEVTGNGAAGQTSDAPLVVSTTKTITDTSYNGIDVAKKPSIDSYDNTKYDGFYSDTYALNQVHKFSFAFTASGGSKVGLYISNSSTFSVAAATGVTLSEAEINNAKSALRMSVVDNNISAYTDTSTFTAGTASLVDYFAPLSTDTYDLFTYYPGTAKVSGAAVTATKANPVALSALDQTRIDGLTVPTPAVSSKIGNASNLFQATTAHGNYSQSELTADGKTKSDGDNAGYICTLDPRDGSTVKSSVITFNVWVDGRVTTGAPSNYTITANLVFYVVTLAA